jgi:Staphylococcal nuclease homologue
MDRHPPGGHDGRRCTRLTLPAVNTHPREVDAPENRSRSAIAVSNNLAALCFGKPATVAPRSTDRYRRTVARVECNGTDASAEQLHAGMAWVFDRYVTDRTLYAVQDEARAERRGLWADREPVPHCERAELHAFAQIDAESKRSIRAGHSAFRGRHNAHSCA